MKDEVATGESFKNNETLSVLLIFGLPPNIENQWFADQITFFMSFEDKEI